MKKRPFLTLIILIVFCSGLGLIIGGVFAERHYRKHIEQARAKSIPPDADIGDGDLFYFFIGTTLGFFVGVAGGSFWYVKAKAEEKEIPHII